MEMGSFKKALIDEQIFSGVPGQDHEVPSPLTKERDNKLDECSSMWTNIVK
jgi:hypothetical protein